MGRTNASKSKAKEKSAAEAKHPTSPETRNRTSNLQKKGDDAISFCKKQKQKLSRTKKSKAHEESDHSEKEAGKLKVTEIRNDSGPKENRKRESSKLAPSPSAKIIPVFWKKRRSVETDVRQPAENKQSLGNTDPDTGTDSKVDSTNAVEKITEEKESMPVNASLLGHESKECEGTVSKAEIQLVGGAALVAIKADVIEKNKDEKESVPENESTSGGMGSESKECDSVATELVIEVPLIEGAALDESKAAGAEEKNYHQLEGLDRGEMVDATAPFALEGTFMECESGSKEDNHGKSCHDILEEEDMGLSKMEKTEVENSRASKKIQSAVIILEDSEKAGTEHETIEGSDEPCTTTDGSKIHSDLVEVDDLRDKKDKEENVTETKKTLLHLTAVAVDGSLENGNVLMTTEPRSSEDLDLMEPDPERNESDRVQVPNDGKDKKHLFQDERENVHDEKLNGNTKCKVISETKLISTETISNFYSAIASNTPNTNRESPQINEVVADGNKLELEKGSNEESSQKSSEVSGDPVFNTTLKGHMQCTTSTEDMNSVRQDSAFVCYPKHADRDNHDEYSAKNDIQDEIEECQDQLCGSTQEFKVSVQDQPSSPQIANPVMSCDDSGVCEKVYVHTKSDNIPEGRLKGVTCSMAGKVHSDSKSGEKLDEPTCISYLDAPSSMATQARYLDTTPNNQGDIVIKMDSADRLTSELRQAEQEGDERQGCKAVFPHFSFQESADQYRSSEDDSLVDNLMDLTDSQMNELDQQCSMNNQQTDPLTNSAPTREMGSGESESKVGCSVGVQTINNSTECADSSSIVQSMIRDLRQLNATVLDIKRQMDSFRIQRCQPSTSSSSYQHQHWKDYSRTWRKPFYKK